MNNALAYFILCRVWSYLLVTPAVYGHSEALDIMSALKIAVIRDEQTDLGAIALIQSTHDWVQQHTLPRQMAVQP